MTIRTMMLAGLMAATAMGASAPAFAQSNDNNGWRNRGEQGEMRSQRQEQRQEQRVQWQDRRDQARDNRADANVQARGDTSGGNVRGNVEVRQPQVVQQQPTPPVNREWRGNRDATRDGNRQDGRYGDRDWGQRSAERQDWRQDRREDRGDRRDWRQDRQQSGRDVRNDDRADGRNDGRYATNRGYVEQRRWNDTNYGNRGYDGRNRLDNRERWSNQRRWDNGWRNDRRYDWQSYRRNYGQVYRSGRYNAPRGWNYGYRQFSVGIFLDSMLYSNNYWLNDPYQYRLPPAYGSLRWVRYYDDALLVDTRDGYVVDVINGFFY